MTYFFAEFNLFQAKHAFLKYYFTLQYWRLKREITGWGINPYLGIAFYLFAFVAISILIFKKIPQASYIYPVLAFLFTYSLSEENRNQFLKTIFPGSGYLKIRLLENIFCAIPFAVFLVFKNEYIIALSTIILSGILSIYGGANKIQIPIPSPFSKKPYEFTVGFRRGWFFIVAVYSITWISIYHHNPNLGIITLAGIFLLCLSFYSHLDPIFYVWIYACSPKFFLLEKIKTALIYSCGLSLLILLPLLYFYPGEIQIILITFFVGLLYIIAGVLAVYVNYPVQMTLSHRIQLYFGILFPPALFLVIPNFYQQARNRLKIVLHVEN